MALICCTRSILENATTAFSEAAGFLTRPNTAISFERIWPKVARRLGIPPTFNTDDWTDTHHALWELTTYEELVEHFSAVLCE